MTHSPEARQLVESLIADGASGNEITRSTGISRHYLRDHYGYTGWPKGYSERSVEAMRANAALRRIK